jgi:hypothetical protein
MDVMRTGVSMLGNLETEQSFAEQQDVADRILATFQQSFATGTVLAMMAYVLKKIPMTTQSVLNSYTYCVVKSQMNCMNK